MGWLCVADLKLIFRDFLSVGWVSLEKHRVPGLFFLLLFGEKKPTTNFLSSVQLEFLKLWDFLDLLFSHWTNYLRRETWCAKPFLCRMTEYLPVFSVVKGVYYSQAELERQVCRINLSVKRCIGAKVLVLCTYFGSAVLISTQYQHVLLL